MAWAGEGKGPRVIKRPTALERKATKAAEVVARFPHWPTLSEIASDLRVAPATALRHLEQAERMGLVTQGLGRYHGKGLTMVPVWIPEE